MTTKIRSAIQCSGTLRFLIKLHCSSLTHLQYDAMKYKLIEVAAVTISSWTYHAIYQSNEIVTIIWIDLFHNILLLYHFYGYIRHLVKSQQLFFDIARKHTHRHVAICVWKNFWSYLIVIQGNRDVTREIFNQIDNTRVTLIKKKRINTVNDSLTVTKNIGDKIKMVTNFISIWCHKFMTYQRCKSYASKSQCKGT